jgi:hypothetical protein
MYIGRDKNNDKFWNVNYISEQVYFLEARMPNVICRPLATWRWRKEVSTNR